MSISLFLFGSGITVVLVIFHVLGLVLLAQTVHCVFGRHKTRHPLLQSTAILALSVLGIMFLHVVEATAWAIMYLALGEFEQVNTALYFSIVTATTLGYGDLTLSDQWRLLSSFEAIGGLILFGASTAFLLETMRHLFRSVEESQSKNRTP